MAATLAKEMKAPVEVVTGHETSGIRRIALPYGWTIDRSDDEKFLPVPRRKVAKVTLHDTESFIGYVKRHGSLSSCTVWCLADYSNGKVGFTSIINDHGEPTDAQNWRDHKAMFTPALSEEWERWNGKHKTGFTQTDFAAFIEDNLKDIVSVDNSPSGAQMLDMALTFEANQDMRFKSAIRLQNGGVQMSFVQDDDAQTLQKMQVFDRFSLGLPVFWNGDPYRLDARLRYRVRDGKLTFWFELIRQDKVLEAATKTMIETIKAQAGMPFFFGEP